MIYKPIPSPAMPPANDLLAESDLEQATGLSAVGAADGRRFPRYYFRALAVATIHPPVGREDEPVQTCYVLTRDLSRGGVSILHPVPLFQSQRVDLTLSDGRTFTLAIRWIRQLERTCYLIGCRFGDVPAAAPSATAK